MDARDFCYWLQGFMEVAGIGTEDDLEGIHPQQAKVVRDHLKLVFEKETPVREIGFKDALQKLQPLQWGGGPAISCSLPPQRRLMGFERTYC